MPEVVPVAYYSREFGQRNGKRLFSTQEIAEEGFWAEPLFRAGLGRCKEKAFKKKAVSEYRSLGIKQLIIVHN